MSWYHGPSFSSGIFSTGILLSLRVDLPECAFETQFAIALRRFPARVVFRHRLGFGIHRHQDRYSVRRAVHFSLLAFRLRPRLPDPTGALAEARLADDAQRMAAHPHRGIADARDTSVRQSLRAVSGHVRRNRRSHSGATAAGHRADRTPLRRPRHGVAMVRDRARLRRCRADRVAQDRCQRRHRRQSARRAHRAGVIDGGHPLPAQILSGGRSALGRADPVCRIACRVAAARGRVRRCGGAMVVAAAGLNRVSGDIRLDSCRQRATRPDAPQ